MTELPASEIPRLLRRNPGLILGPSMTCGPSSIAGLHEKFRMLGYGMGLDFFAYNTTAGKVVSQQERDAVRSFWNGARCPTELADLARVKWSAILSTAVDGNFDNLASQESDRHLAGRLITVVDDLATDIPPRTIPIYKLLGSVARDNIVMSRPAYVVRKAQWRTAVRGFGDHVKGAPVICLGLDESFSVLLDLLGEMTAERNAAPKAIVLLGDDPLANNPELRELIDSFSRCVVVKGTLRDLLKALTGPRPDGPAGAALKDENALLDLGSLKHLVTLVNDQLSLKPSRSERNRLLDLLFAPTAANWEPFAADLDFKRTISTDLLAEISALIDVSTFSSGAFVVTGRAASGKTTVLKRTALDLARQGRIVLWLKSAFYPDNQRVLLEIFRAVAKIRDSRRVVVVMDDPATFAGLSARDVANTARAAHLDILLLVSVRSSEWRTQNSGYFVGPLDVSGQLEVPDSLDEGEWSILPDYLVALGIAENRSFAETRIRGIETKNAQDTLSMLYYLLPETRRAITTSVRDEFFRLGDVAGLSQVIIGAVTHSAQLLKQAYEMVAVANRFGPALPVEVLVSALHVDYSEWLDAAEPSGPAWGILYPEDAADEFTFSYRTRNGIVNRILVEAVNGGVTSHAGEVRIMTNLMKACTGTAPAYRQFCTKVLIGNDTMKTLEYEEGLRLFDAAIAALPHPDKTLVHHKGLWIKNKGRDPIQASRVLEEALNTPQYPYATRGEADEHIHNSLAATALDALDLGLVDVETGKSVILEHLSHARSSQFYNPHSVHVNANAILRLLEKMKNAETSDAISLSNQAIADVDRALIVCSVHDNRSRSPEETEMLSSVRAKLLSRLSDIDALKADADRMWKEFHNPRGFALAARKLYDAALTKQKGTTYRDAFEYSRDAIARIESEGDEPGPELCEVALHIYYRWRISRRISTANVDNPIDWDLIKRFSDVVLRARTGSVDPLSRYLQGLALAHLDRWSDANTVFATLRSSVPPDLLWVPRDYLLDANGSIRRIQGRMRAGGTNLFLYSDALQTDVRADKPSEWPTSGEVAHAYVYFSFGGYTAIRSLPT